MVCEHEYMNISPPPPPNYRAGYSPALKATSNRVLMYIIIASLQTVKTINGIRIYECGPLNYRSSAVPEVSRVHSDKQFVLDSYVSLFKSKLSLTSNYVWKFFYGELNSHQIIVFLNYQKVETTFRLEVGL